MTIWWLVRMEALEHEGEGYNLCVKVSFFIFFSFLACFQSVSKRTCSRFWYDFLFCTIITILPFCSTVPENKAFLIVKLSRIIVILKWEVLIFHFLKSQSFRKLLDDDDGDDLCSCLGEWLIGKCLIPTDRMMTLSGLLNSIIY